MADVDHGFRLSRRRLLGGIAVSGLAAVGGGAGTMALFVDTETSSGNTIQAGTLNLSMEAGGPLGTSYSIQDAEPGNSGTKGLRVVLSNVGSLGADHLEIDISNTATEDNDGNLGNGTTPGPDSDSVDGAGGMAEYVEIEGLEYIDTSGSEPVNKNSLTDANENGFIDLEDAAATENESVFDDLDPPTLGGSDTAFEIQVSVHESMPNAYQGDVLETTIAFTLNQEASQDS